MAALFFQAIGVAASQLALYLLLPLWGMRLSLRNPADWLRAAIAGLAAQATFGMMASWWIGPAQKIAPIAYGMCWIAARFLRRRRPAAKPDAPFDPLLVVLMVIALGVRWVHPLSTWALGQSDAYAHLMFLDDVLRVGRLSNPIYPAGFAWILALPCFVFDLDPYTVARFGGAFHGVLLVLSIYVLLNAWRGRTAARAAASVVAGFPLAELLIKTGVGAFANQVGLLALPAGWWAAARCWSGEARGLDTGLLFVVFLLLGVATPMMLIQFCLLLGIAAVAVIARERSGVGWTPALRAALLAIPAVLLFAGHLYHAGGVARGQTSAYLVGEEVSGPINREDADPGMDIERGQIAGMLIDFVSIKRAGFGSRQLNAPAFLLLLTFAAFAVHGLKRRNIPEIFLGIWGAVTTLQTWTGILQLSFYQREGWSLMIASIALGGWFVQEIVDRIPTPWGARVCAACCFGAAALGLWMPPAHRFFASPAEDEMIAFVRALDGDPRARAKWRADALAWNAFDTAKRIYIVVRPISGFSNRFGDPVHALAKGRLRATDRAVVPSSGELTIGLLDGSSDELPSSSFAMRLLQPGLTGEFVKRRQEADRASAEIEASLRALGVDMTEISLSPRLRALVLRPPSF